MFIHYSQVFVQSDYLKSDFLLWEDALYQLFQLCVQHMVVNAKTQIGALRHFSEYLFSDCK